MTGTLTVQARFSDTRGNGVGRWRNFGRAEDMREARWYIGRLIPSCQVRVMEGRRVVVAPCRARDFQAQA